MVEKEVVSLMLEQMRKTDGFNEFLFSAREEYLRLVRRTLVCNSFDELMKLKASLGAIKDVLEMTGMSKEDVTRWTEIR